MIGVYGIVNLINNKIYIGSSINLSKRKASHFSHLRKNNHNSSHLQKAFNKYGEDNFRFIILEELLDIELLLVREQYYIDSHDSTSPKKGYNIRRIAESNVGLKHTEGTKRRMSQNNVGMKGKKHSEETKKKMSQSRKGENNAMYGKKRNVWNKGVSMTDEQKEKLRQIALNRTDEQNKKLGRNMQGANNPMYGKKRDPEVQRKAWETRRSRTSSTS